MHIACYNKLLLFSWKFSGLKQKKKEGHDGPVSLHWLIREIPSYQALQYLRVDLKQRLLTWTKIGSYVKHQEDFEKTSPYETM